MKSEFMNIFMSPSFAIRLLCFCALVFMLPGCAMFNSDYSKQDAVQPHNPYAQSGIDELLVFGARMAGMPEAERADLCKSLLNTQKTSSADGKQLLLMVGRLLSDACGDIPKILTDINAVSPQYISDEPVLRLIAIDTQILTRMLNQSKKLSATERKKKKVKTAIDSKESQEVKKDEARLLREKLEAIRTIEKQMDENVEAY